MAPMLGPWLCDIGVAVAEELARVWVCRVVGWLIELVEEVDVVEDVRDEPPGVKHSSML